MNDNRLTSEPPQIEDRSPDLPPRCVASIDPSKDVGSNTDVTLPKQGLSTSSRLPLIVNLAWLIVPSLILFAAFILQVGENRHVIIPYIQETVPETCGMYARFGIDCPGCGLTRSFIHLAHGNASAAWQLSPAALVVFSFVTLQIPLATAHLLTRNKPRRSSSSRGMTLLARCTRLNEWVLIALVVILMAQWTWRLMLGKL